LSISSNRGIVFCGQPAATCLFFASRIVNIEITYILSSSALTTEVMGAAELFSNNKYNYDGSPNRSTYIEDQLEGDEIVGEDPP